MLNSIQDYLLILQINDAIFPIGSYTQSYGLETYVQRKLVTDVGSLRKFLKQNLMCNLLYTDILAVKLAYEAAMMDDLNKIYELDNILSAVKVAKETRNASSKLSSRFIKTVVGLELNFKNNILLQYDNLIHSRECLGHHAITYGVMCGEQKLDKHYSLLNFSYAQISATVNNAVKLIPLSQTSGQSLLKDMSSSLEKAILQVNDLSEIDLGRSVPGFELRSMQHEALYSRLYMS